MILGIFFGLLNVPSLVPFDTAEQQQDPIIKFGDHVDPESRPTVDYQLNNPVTDRVKVSEMPRRS
jgi:hypothetical protein